MQYLVDQYDKDHKVSYPFGTPEYYETLSWVSLLRYALSIRTKRCRQVGQIAMLTSYFF
jgi:hypothetical protein